jgi:hypothetical protein
MKVFNQKFIDVLKKVLNRENILIEPYHLFQVRITTSHHSTYLVKYIQSRKAVIEESLTGCWTKVIQVPIEELLHFQIYITNPTENKKLKCNIEVNELSDDNDIINTSKFSFQVGLTLETWKWKSFEVKSILE